MTSIKIKRNRQTFVCDPRRVIAKYLNLGSGTREKGIIGRILSLPGADCKVLLDEVLEEFSGRHRAIREILLSNFTRVKHHLENPDELSPERRLLIGAYFTHEYSVESTALFNPSIVPHVDQSGLPSGSLRFIMSLRAIGEGHVSSIVFRSGVINRENHILMDPLSHFLEMPRVELNPVYDVHTFLLKLKEMGVLNEPSQAIFNKLPKRFHYRQLMECIKKEKALHSKDLSFTETARIIEWIAQSNYEETFREESLLSERVIFPVSRDESKGIEDARFVKFTDDDGEVIYFATYTAYNGNSILPMLIETRDFISFRMCTLNGKAAIGKGMALFPRKINGKYTIISRQDGENLFIMQSDNLHFWDEKELLKVPEETWELLLVGNCGSPIETEHGWILLTHGVGPMRKYCIGVVLLDLDDPSKIIGRLRDPLIFPREDEREGYVPNVVYTCGALIHNGELIIPYAVSDTSSGIATVKLENLIQGMVRSEIPRGISPLL
ncbi:MAG: glycoside hydrolase family 130 protein [Candidatus Eremiobacteraeota bacterium]|nr:glycoside hydrolase family 130 protein [Candidatus Eremiobacteraeota bacterium]